MSKNKPLTEKQEEFCQQYVVDLNATQAATRAGYSSHTANEQGARLLAKASVRQRIDELKQAKNDRVKLTAEYVLEKIMNTIERCEMEGEHTPLLKGCELLGKHLKLFTDKLEVDVDVSVSETLRKARERAKRKAVED